MSKHIFLLCCTFLVLLFPKNLASQANQGGTPKSFSHSKLETAPVKVMPPIDMARLIREDSLNQNTKDIPWRFGENMEVDYSPKNSGRWDTLSDNSRLWRLAVQSEGALTINLTFDQFKLPVGATMFIYNSDHTEVIGSFTAENNQETGMFAATLVPGDKMTVEYNEPLNLPEPGSFRLMRVTHGYKDAFAAMRAFGSSGSCEVNVNCPDGATWQTTKRSVVMLVSGSSGFCSGALINNTGNNQTPYILTANHCYSDPSTWIFWFNWESPTCANPASSPTYQSVSGATLKAKRDNSDFCLVQINGTNPLASITNPVFAGWDRSANIPMGGIGIHHPAGDIKKISFDDDILEATSYALATGTNALRADWDRIGVTEGGSSGSPLFDPNHHIVGQLYGGPSSCSSTGANTSDFYGRFFASWTGTSATDRLSDWLDPTNTGVSFLDEIAPNGTFGLTVTGGSASFCSAGSQSFSTNVVNYGYSGNVTLSTIGVPSWLSVTLGATSVTSPSTTNMTLTYNGYAPAGAYTFTIQGVGGIITQTTVVNLTILGTPIATAAINPANAAVGVATTPTLTWAAVSGATSYNIQVADNASFSTIIASQLGVTTTSFTLSTTLSQGTTYYWKVQSVNACGTGAETIFSFTTGYCKTYMSSNIPLAISATGTPIISSNLTISSSQNIGSVDVINVTGTHSYIADVRIEIKHPNGTYKVLYPSGQCGSNDNFSFSFSDGAATNISSAPCTPSPVGQGGTYKPSAALSPFIGLTASGVWQLRVSDVAAQDGGNLNSWGLNVCYAQPEIPMDIPASAGVYTADQSILDLQGWTHYIKSSTTTPITSSDVLLLSVKKDANSVISNSNVTLGVGNPYAGVTAITGNVFSPDWRELNRYWNVAPTTQPGGSGVDVRFYYTPAEFSGIQAAVPSASSLKFFKFIGNIDPNPANGHAGASASNFVILPHTTGTLGTNHYAEFHANSFSGGGVGATPTAALPVTWLYFKGDNAERNHHLSWATAQEFNASHFTIEHSLSGVNFRKIGEIKAKGNTKSPVFYAFDYKLPQFGDNYYRLRQVDIDGKETFSDLVRLEFESPNESVKVVPNPNNGDFKIVFSKETTQETILKMHDAKGALVWENIVVAGTILNEISIPNLSKGMYFLEVQNENRVDFLKIWVD
jgi:subtilisin-like proprotein convertase family protein